MILRAATVQFEPQPGDKPHNLARIEHFARAAAAEGAQIAAFPEMCLLGYWHLTKRDAAYLRSAAEPDDGPSIARVSTLAGELGIGIGFGLLIEGGGRSLEGRSLEGQSSKGRSLARQPFEGRSLEGQPTEGRALAGRALAGRVLAGRVLAGQPFEDRSFEGRSIEEQPIAGRLSGSDLPDGRLFNAYAVCLPDGAVHIHRKLHAFEHEVISSGSRYTVFDTPWGGRVGVLICYDNNLVENVRATALLGAQVLLAPHQTGGTDSVSPHGMKPIPLPLWENRHADPSAVEAAFRGSDGRGWLLRWLPSRAHDNGLFIVFSNGVGRDDDEVRTGNAMVIDPYGRIIAESAAIADDMVIADLDLGLIPQSTGRRWLRARRPELYGPLVAQYGDEVDARTARFS